SRGADGGFLVGMRGGMAAEMQDPPFAAITDDIETELSQGTLQLPDPSTRRRGRMPAQPPDRPCVPPRRPARRANRLDALAEAPGVGDGDAMDRPCCGI